MVSLLHTCKGRNKRRYSYSENEYYTFSDATGAILYSKTSRLALDIDTECAFSLVLIRAKQLNFRSTPETCTTVKWFTMSRYEALQSCDRKREALILQENLPQRNWLLILTWLRHCSGIQDVADTIQPHLAGFEHSAECYSAAEVEEQSHIHITCN